MKNKDRVKETYAIVEFAKCNQWRIALLYIHIDRDPDWTVDCANGKVP